MKTITYDEEADAAYVYVSLKKPYNSIEISPNIIVDVSESNRIIGVEILDASLFLSDILGFKVEKKQLSSLGCKVREAEALYLQFNVGKEKASLVLPRTYNSAILDVED